MGQGRLPLGNLLIHFPFLPFPSSCHFCSIQSDLLAESGEFKDRLKTTIPCFTKQSDQISLLNIPTITADAL